MTNWRVLYEVNGGEGRYDEVEAEDMCQAIWQVAQSSVEAGDYGAKFVSIQDTTEE